MAGEEEDCESNHRGSISRSSNKKDQELSFDMEREVGTLRWLIERHRLRQTGELIRRLGVGMS